MILELSFLEWYSATKSANVVLSTISSIAVFIFCHNEREAQKSARLQLECSRQSTGESEPSNIRRIVPGETVYGIVKN